MRTTPPESHPISTIKPLNPQRSTLNNGVPVYVLKGGDEPIINISILFPAGARFQSQRLIAGTTSRLITEGGSKNHSAASLAEVIDFHGSSLHAQCDKDYATVSLLTLQKHLSTLLPVFSDVLHHPLFPVKELKTHLKQEKQDWLIERTKPKYLARVEMSHLLFGSKNAYGYNLQPSDFEAVLNKSVDSFFKEHYLSPLAVLISGQVEPEDLNQIDQYLGMLPYKTSPQPIPVSIPTIPRRDEIRQKYTGVPKAVQSAIRIAARACSHTHPDYPALLVMNTLLGGYFGSRLMRSIREEKGYTYGIYSMLVNMVHADVLIISTEVGSDVTFAALQSIYQELETLQNELPPESELFRVKQYLMGEMLRTFDGPFQQQERILSLLELNTPLDYFDMFPKQIQDVTSHQVMAMAQKYLRRDNLFEVIAGSDELPGMQPLPIL